MLKAAMVGLNGLRELGWPGGEKTEMEVEAVESDLLPKGSVELVSETPLLSPDSRCCRSGRLLSLEIDRAWLRELGEKVIDEAPLGVVEEEDPASYQPF